MIPKLGGTREDGRGRSFKSLFDYILHDKNRASTRKRVAWAEPVNCGLGGNLRRAWYEMLLTWENRSALKRAAGIPLTGRDNDRPVLHLILAWHPSQSPDRREMMDAALSALDWLDLGEHQAIVAAHTDEPQQHVHIAINTVHPGTGRTANLYQSKKALSAWAMHWEDTHGGLIIRARALNRLHRLSTPPQEPPSAAPQQPAVLIQPLHAAPANDNGADSGEDGGVTPCPSRSAPARTLRARFRIAALARAMLTPLLALFARRGEPTSMSPPAAGQSLHTQAPPHHSRPQALAPQRAAGSVRPHPP